MSQVKQHNQQKRGSFQSASVLSEGSGMNKSEVHSDGEFPVIIRISSKGSHFICYGPASSYEEKFPVSLVPYLDEQDFSTFIQELNKRLRMYWPPKGIFCCAYLFSLMTSFLSCYLPVPFFHETIKMIQWLIDEQNIKWETKQIKVSWHRKWFKSWIEFAINDHPQQLEFDCIIENKEQQMPMQSP